MSVHSSKIQDFFKDQTLFLTGGSGFLGKILIEKLLRDCPKIQKIYVLIRAKKNKTPEQRFEDLFSYPCFDLLKSRNSDSLKKVHLVNGDCQKPFLGLKDEDLELLVAETSCVIHAAASVRFDQSLKEATYNVRATRDLLELAQKMKKLKVFVYVSTAYSNCLHPHIKEEFYPPEMTSEELLAVVNSLKEDTLEAITPKLLGKWPNTYIFTKCISEDLVQTANKHLPIVLVRPAIVTATIAEPMPGWIDNFYGVVGIVAGAALGVLRSLNANPNAAALIVPVDYVSNCILSAMWKRGTTPSSPTIYNYVGNKETRLTWRDLMNRMEKYCWQAASEKVLWYYCFKVRENKIWHKICVFFLHTVQAYVVDFFLVCLGRPAIALKNYERINKLLDLLSYFSTRSWEVDYDNVKELWSQMEEEDREVFPFDLQQVDWDKYALDSILGARLYLFKDTPDTISKGKRKVKILFVLHYTVVAVLWYLLYKFVMLVLGLIF